MRHEKRGCVALSLFPVMSRPFDTEPHREEAVVLGQTVAEADKEWAEQQWRLAEDAPEEEDINTPD